MSKIKIGIFLISFFFFFISLMNAAEEKPSPASTCFPDLQSEIIREINLARKDPKKYTEYLEDTKKFYEGNIIKRPGKKAINTQEGMAVVDEAIAYLKTVLPQSPVFFSRGLSLAARDHIMDLSGSGQTGHKGTDGSMPGDRANRYGKWDRAIGENICYGFDTAREIVIWLIIDDGYASRGHRINFFRPDFAFAGVTVCDHLRYKTICVITFAGEYKEKAKK